MKEVKPKLIESFCTEDESARPTVFCKLVSTVLSTQEMQGAEENCPHFSGPDRKADSF